MIPSFKPGILSSNIIRAAGGGGGSDVTPNAVDWFEASSTGCETSTNTQTISGISTSINLSVSWIFQGGDQSGIFSYSKNGGANVTISSNPTTISVSNSDTLNFTLASSVFGLSNDGRTITVTNTSDNNTVLDTFDISFFCDP
jgi:hypothetical protein